MYNDTVNGGMFNGRDLEELPEAIGPVAQLQEKLYVPVKEYPDVSAARRPLTFHTVPNPPRSLSCLLLPLLRLPGEAPQPPPRHTDGGCELTAAADAPGDVTQTWIKSIMTPWPPPPSAR